MPQGKIGRYFRKMPKGSRPSSTNAKQNRRIKKLENIVYPSLEWKSKDITSFDVDVSNAGAQNYPMFKLAKGDTNSTREGDKVSLRRGTLHLALTRGDTSNIIRVLVVATPSATFAGLTDVLEYPNYSSAADGIFVSPYQVKASNSEQTYQVLVDRIYQLPNDRSTITAKIPIKLPKKGKSCEFVGDGDVAPNNYNLSLLMISDSTATPHPKASYVMRWKYLDL